MYVASTDDEAMGQRPLLERVMGTRRSLEHFADLGMGLPAPKLPTGPLRRSAALSENLSFAGT